MDRQKFSTYQRDCVRAMRQIISKDGEYQKMYDAAVPAYTDTNGLVRFLFWRRLWLTVSCLMSRGPFSEALDFGCGSGIFLPLLVLLSASVRRPLLLLLPWVSSSVLVCRDRPSL